MIEIMLFIGRVINKNKDFLCLDEDVIIVINDFIKIACSNGFEGKIPESNNYYVVYN